MFWLASTRRASRINIPTVHPTMSLAAMTTAQANSCPQQEPCRSIPRTCARPHLTYPHSFLCSASSRGFLMSHRSVAA